MSNNETRLTIVALNSNYRAFRVEKGEVDPDNKAPTAVLFYLSQQLLQILSVPLASWLLRQ